MPTAWAAAILLFTGVDVGANQPPGPTLISVATGRYRIHTNLSVDEAMTFGRHMDRVFDEYDRRFRSFQARHSESMPLYLFATEQQYRSFLDEHGINSAHTGGLFFVQPSLNGLATWVKERPRSQTYAVLQHEGFHQFANQYIGPHLPIWANEGLAQYFEDGIFVRDLLLLGQRNARRVRAVRKSVSSGDYIAFDRMLTMSPQQWSKRVVSGDPGAVAMYDQAWSMVYYLIRTRKKRSIAFGQYLQLLNNGTGAKAAFENAFGDNIEEFQGAWIRFVMSTEPDVLNTAISRMEFLGQGLRAIHARGYPMPKTLSELRSVLQKSNFWMEVRGHSWVVRYSADDDHNYGFVLPGSRFNHFRLIRSSNMELPPKITAQGLNPMPTMVWSRDREGQLMQEIEYR